MCNIITLCLQAFTERDQSMVFPMTKPCERPKIESAKVRVGTMARILGISRQHLSNLARRGKMPTETIDGVRQYDVDEILKRTRFIRIQLPKLDGRDWGRRDMDWAFDALSVGPCNMPMAPSRTAWFLYLEAKRNKVFHRMFTRKILHSRKQN